MPTEIVTTQDLQELKCEILYELKQMIQDLTKVKQNDTPKYLTTAQVGEMLNVSLNTLQTMRNNRDIPYVKLNGKVLYKYEDVLSFLDKRTA